MEIKKHILRVLLAATLILTHLIVPVSAQTPENLALNSTATASGLEVNYTFFASAAVDGNREGTSRWSSAPIPSENYSSGSDQWLELDLGEQKTFNRVDLYWEASAGTKYTLQGRNDTSADWEVFYTEDNGDGELDSITLENTVTYQYVRLYITYGNGRYSSVSLYEIELYNYSADSIAQSALDSLTVPSSTKESFSLTTSSGQVSIGWQSDQDCLTVDNGTATYSAPQQNTWVTLTATATYNGTSVEKTFKVMVLTPDAVVDNYEIYPTPQSIQMNFDIIQLTDSINVIYGSDVEDMVKNRVNEVLTENGYTVVENSNDDSLTKFYVGIHEKNDAVNTYVTDNSISTAIFEDSVKGYDKHILSINSDNSIVALGMNNDSTYYAMASLDQILQKSNNGSVTTTLIEDYADTQYRGIVEGYYGIPFSVEDRLSAFEYMKDYKMNMFVYGPKGDPYHLGNWMDDYPTTVTDEQRAEGLITQSDIQQMTTKANQCNVDFVWSSHPAMLGSIDFTTDEGIAKGTEDLMTKFSHMYDLGVRQFAIFVDDIDLTVAYNQRAGHALLLDAVWDELETRYNGENSTSTSQVKPLYFVPSFYALNFGNSTARNAYLQEIGKVDQDILIGFTGDSVFSSVRSSSMQTFANLVNRDPVMWWNYPVNDGDDDELFMEALGTPYGNGRTFTVENNISNMGGLLSNPMNQAESSKVSFFGVADYSWNTGAFNASENWAAAFASYSDDEKVQNAIRTFASYSATLHDGAGINSLLEAYKNDSSNSASIQAKMQELINACDTILALKNGNDTSLANFADEVEPWVNKLKDMATIINNSLIVLDADDPLTVWSTFTEANILYNEMTNNPDYMVDSVEGQGSAAGGSPVQYEALPANSSIRPFTDYIFQEANAAYTLPQKGDASVITNATTESSLTAEVENDTGTISGSDTITLQPGKYIGIDFKAISPINDIDVTLPKGTVLEGSVNGKEWTTIKDGDSDLSYAYIRVVNNSDKDVKFDLSSFAVNMIKKTTIVDGTTSSPIYQNFYMSNTYDGDKGTYVWTAANQAVGDTMTWTLNQTTGVKDVTITFTGSDFLSDKAVIEVSEDGDNWTEIGSTSRDYLTNHGYVYSCDGNGTKAKYVRLRITEVGLNAWLRVYEIEVNKEANEQLAKPQAYLSDKSSASATADRDVSTYTALGTNDTLTYQLIDNVKADTINILYALGEEEGDVEAFINCSNGEVSLGKLTGDNTTFDVSSYRNIKNVVIKTNGQSITVFDIYEQGTTYTDANRVTVQDAVNTKPDKKQSAYTTESYKAYKDVLDKINALLKTKELSETEAQALITELTTARNNLVERTQPAEVDKSKLLEELDNANALKETDYTAESWKVLVDAIAKANAAADKLEPTQDEVDEATEALQEAIKALEKANQVEVSEGETPSQTTEETKPATSTKTGDDTNIGIYLAGIILSIILLIRRRMIKE